MDSDPFVRQYRGVIAYLGKGCLAFNFTSGHDSEARLYMFVRPSLLRRPFGTCIEAQRGESSLVIYENESKYARSADLKTSDSLLEYSQRLFPALSLSLLGFEGRLSLLS